MGDAPLPDLNAAILRAQQAANSGPSKSWLEKPANQGASAFGVNSLGLFSGNVAGPFGLKGPRSGGMAAQLDYERQRLAEVNNAGHQVLAQAAAAAAPAVEAIRQAGSMEVYGGGTTSFVGSYMASRGDDGFGVA